jgi:hypothetical protein
MEERQLTDLGQHAIDRCRTCIGQVAQLGLDEMEIAGLLLAVAADMVDGAVSFLEEDGKRSRNEALAIALGNFSHAVSHKEKQRKKATKHVEQTGG